MTVSNGGTKEKRLGESDAHEEAHSVRETAEVISRIDNKSDDSGHPLGIHYELAADEHVKLLDQIGSKGYKSALVSAGVRAEIADQVGPEIWRKFHKTITDILLEKRGSIWNPTIRINDIYEIVLKDERMKYIFLSVSSQHRILFERLLKDELDRFMSEVEQAKQGSYLALVEKRRVLQG